jgi:hypothetical protein
MMQAAAHRLEQVMVYNPYLSLCLNMKGTGCSTNAARRLEQAPAQGQPAGTPGR